MDEVTDKIRSAELTKIIEGAKTEEWFCPDCDAKICDCVLKRIRLQENAMVVAKQALESLDHLNTRLTMQLDAARKERDEWKEKSEKTFHKDIKGKMNKIVFPAVF